MDRGADIEDKAGAGGDRGAASAGGAGGEAAGDDRCAVRRAAGGGRCAGWLKAEFDAVVTTPFEERGAVTDEYLRVFNTVDE